MPQAQRPGKTKLTELDDTGFSLTGQSGKVVTVTSSETGFELTTPSSGGGGAVTSVAGRTGAVTLSTSDISGLGTAAPLNVPASGNAASGEVVKGSDTRLTDSRTPTTHTHTVSQVTDAGNSASRNVGTTTGTVAAGDDSRITGAAQKASNLSDLADKPTARTNLGLGTAATQASTAFDASGAATSAVSAHVAASDPHTQYHNNARGDARYDALGAASTAVAAYAAATEGTSFPTSGLYDGQPFYRTDFGRLFHYNLTNTVWLSEPYSLTMAPFAGTDTFTVDGLIARGAAIPGLYPNAWIDSFTIAYEVSNNSGGRFWAYTVQEPSTNIILVQGDTSADGNGVFKATKTQSDFGSFGMGGVIDNTARTALELTIADNGGADPFKLYGISLQVRDALYT